MSLLYFSYHIAALIIGFFAGYAIAHLLARFFSPLGIEITIKSDRLIAFLGLFSGIMLHDVHHEK